MADARVLARDYIHGRSGPVCPVAAAVIRNLFDDLSAANSEIRALQRDRSAAQRRITDLYERLVELQLQEQKDKEHDQATRTSER